MNAKEHANSMVDTFSANYYNNEEGYYINNRQEGRAYARIVCQRFIERYTEMSNDKEVKHYRNVLKHL